MAKTPSPPPIARNPPSDPERDQSFRADLGKVVAVGPSIVGVSPEFKAALELDNVPVVASLGRRIATLRGQRKLTQGELADLLGKSRATVNQYESGAIEPPLKMVAKIAETLDVAPAAIAFGAPVRSSDSSERFDVARGSVQTGDFVALSPSLATRLMLTAAAGAAWELTNDAPAFGLRRGDLLLLDTAVRTFRGDGNLYAVLDSTDALALAKSEVQLVDSASRIKVTLGNSQISEVDAEKVEVVGLVRGTLRAE